MPSLRKRVSSYFRQLSFHNEPREKRLNFNDNSFVVKYLQGHIALKDGPQVLYGKNPTDLPNYELGQYDIGENTIIGCYSGPNGGLTTVKRIEKHLSVTDPDIDFIDTALDDQVTVKKKSEKTSPRNGYPIDNTTMIIKVAGQEYCVTSRKKHKKSRSLGSVLDFATEIDRSNKIDVEISCSGNNNNNNNVDLEAGEVEEKKEKQADDNRNFSGKVETGRKGSDRGYNLSKSKSDGNPFQHRKKGKIIRIQQRPRAQDTDNATPTQIQSNKDDELLPKEWNRKSDCVYGISDSLYDRNLVTKNRNGDPIADCFGIIARGDSALLALADGVNWGEKASIAAKSAVHGCLHYLNKTIFNDTKPFESLTIKEEDSATKEAAVGSNRMVNTREVFVCLLRAFNCAHDLILENKGMLTTLTVAVVLPLKPKSARQRSEEQSDDEYKNFDQERQFYHSKSTGKKGDNTQTIEHDEQRYVCCVCNVGDTLAYVYSQKYGVRELTKGSHDINCNRDMRDALGALGPVDGINPELSNLTLSVTTLQKGDVVMVASDGLTDNFDPNVCKFTVNLPDPLKVKQQKQNKDKEEKASEKQPQPSSSTSSLSSTVPAKPPRKPKNPETDSKKSTDEDRVEHDNPLVAEFLKENSVEPPKPDGKRTSSLKTTETKRAFTDNRASSLRRQTSQPRQVTTTTATTSTSSLSSSLIRSTNHPLAKSASTSHATRPPPVRRAPSTTSSSSSPSPRQTAANFFRSRTSLDFRPSKQVPRNEDGIPLVTPLQRYEITLLLMQDVLRKGISGRESQCTTARKLCENLVSFTFSITAAKRRTLEDPDMYFDNRNGVLVEVSAQEKKLRRKRGLERVQGLPGKLDHVSVVAYNVGNFAF